MLILVSLEAPQRGVQLSYRASETKFTWDFSVTSDLHDVIPWKEKSKFQVNESQVRNVQGICSGLIHQGTISVTGNSAWWSLGFIHIVVSLILPTDAGTAGGHGGHTTAWEADEQMLLAN